MPETQRFTVDQKVYVLSGWGWTNTRLTRVHRVTKTLVVLDQEGGPRFRQQDGHAVGMTGAWTPKIEERSPALDAQHAVYQARIAVSRLDDTLTSMYRALDKAVTVEQVEEIIATFKEQAEKMLGRLATAAASMRVKESDDAR